VGDFEAGFAEHTTAPERLIHSDPKADFKVGFAEHTTGRGRRTQAGIFKGRSALNPRRDSLCAERSDGA
jgi:hypothetical protein